MEIEYKQFKPNTNQFKNLTFSQCEINRRGQFLHSKGYLKRSQKLRDWFLYTYDETGKLSKTFTLENCWTRDDRFIVYKEAVNHITKEILRENIFEN